MLRITLVGALVGTIVIGILGGLMGAIGKSAATLNTFSGSRLVREAAFASAIRGLVVGILAGIVVGWLLGVVRPNMRGWVAGLIIGLLLCSIIGIMTPLSSSYRGWADRGVHALMLGAILGVGGGGIGCVIGAIADLAFSSSVTER